MELKEFIYLKTLAEEGSVSKAAEQLYMAQSSLSQFLQQYESDLGVKLFIRTPKGIRPTANGRIFINRLEKLMIDYQRAQNELWDNENMKGGRVSFGISSFRGQRMLPKILTRFHSIYPDVAVDVVEENSLVLEDLLLEGKLDVAVVALPAQKLKNEAKLLKKEEVYLVVAKNHPLLKKARYGSGDTQMWVDLKDAAEYNFILSYHDTILGTLSRNLFRKKRLKYTASHDNITAAMAVSMASAGLGIAFTYASCVESNDQFELLRIGKEGVFVELGVAFPSREYHSKASEMLELVVRDVYINDAPLTYNK